MNFWLNVRVNSFICRRKLNCLDINLVLRERGMNNGQISLCNWRLEPDATYRRVVGVLNQPGELPLSMISWLDPKTDLWNLVIFIIISGEAFGEVLWQNPVGTQEFLNYLFELMLIFCTQVNPGKGVTVNISMNMKLLQDKGHPSMSHLRNGKQRSRYSLDRRNA